MGPLISALVSPLPLRADFPDFVAVLLPRPLVPPLVVDLMLVSRVEECLDELPATELALLACREKDLKKLPKDPDWCCSDDFLNT